MTTPTKRQPPIKCTPCRVTYAGERYRIYSDGSVSRTLAHNEISDLGLGTVRAVLDYESSKLSRYTPHSEDAKIIRREAARLRRNRNARERNQAMRDLGLKHTPCGWE